MAYNPLYLDRTSADQIGGLADIRVFRYTTTDSLATVLTDNYFNTGPDATFNIGDIIKVIVVDNLNNSLRTTAEFYEIYVSSIT
jgi:hypothetical protein